MQLAEWTLCVVAARVCVGALVVASANGLLLPVASAIDRLYAGRPTALLFSVMVACPLAMNTAQVGLGVERVCGEGGMEHVRGRAPCPQVLAERAWGDINDPDRA